MRRVVPAVNGRRGAGIIDIPIVMPATGMSCHEQRREY
jgi:hypothetical protein